MMGYACSWMRDFREALSRLQYLIPSFFDFYSMKVIVPFL